MRKANRCSLGTDNVERGGGLQLHVIEIHTSENCSRNSQPAGHEYSVPRPRQCSWFGFWFGTMSVGCEFHRGSGSYRCFLINQAMMQMVSTTWVGRHRRICRISMALGALGKALKLHGCGTTGGTCMDHLPDTA